MLQTIVLAIVAILAAILLFAATRPDSFRVQRATVIQAAPDRIFGFLEDFRQWSAWSPWEKRDPSMTRTHGGAPSGVGAVYAWQGAGKVGAGRMEITESSAPAKVVIKLDFQKPFEAHNTAEFTLEAMGEATQVTWAMYGPSPFMAKLMGIFFSMDAMVGRDFEAGLANLKAAAEK